MGTSGSGEARGLATRIARELRERGHAAYFAGGCVRDELLGLDPTDYDVATDATPDEIRSYFPHTAEVGASFGVMLVRERRLVVEVATFRADGPYSDKRRPDRVEFSDEVADAGRRDFTINALFLDPLAADEAGVRGRDIRGHVIDHVGGLGDLERGVVRAVGDASKRLSEDHLRALRAVRFAARFKFRIDGETEEAIRECAGELRGVSRERIGDELRRMMREGETRANAVWMLQFMGLDAPVLGSHVDRVPRVLGRLGADTSYPACLAAWAIDRGEIVELTQVAGLVRAWREALCLSNEERDSMRAVLGGLGMLEREWPGLGVAGQKRAAAAGWFGEAVQLLAARNREEFVRCRRRVLELEQSPGGIHPEPLVTGDDLVAIGIRPGPGLGEAIERVYDAQLEGRVGTKAEALELARSLGV